MKVHLERTGGIAGMRMRYDLESGDPELRRLVDAAFAEAQTTKPAVPDSFTYSVTVTDDDGKTTHRAWNENDLRDASRALVDRLREHPETR